MGTEESTLPVGLENTCGGDEPLRVALETNGKGVPSPKQVREGLGPPFVVA